MTDIKLKRVYDVYSDSDGYRILVDRLWPRGMKKEKLHYDLWEKEIAPSTELREWFHQDPDNRWNEFQSLYKKELEHSEAAKEFKEEVKKHKTVTLLYASKDTAHNHAKVIKEFLEK